MLYLTTAQNRPERTLGWCDVYLRQAINYAGRFCFYRQDNRRDIFYSDPKDDPGHLHDFRANAFPNGIDLSGDGKRPFVAVIDLKSKKSPYLKLPENVKVGSVNGFYFYRNRLIAVQPFEKEKPSFFFSSINNKLFALFTNPAELSTNRNYPMFRF